MLRLWVRHLAATAAGLSVDSIHIGKDHAEKAFQPPHVNQEQAAGILQELITLYQTGMHAPLPLFPRASATYAQRRFAEKSNEQDKALAEAHKAWKGGQYMRAEREDSFLRVIYQDAEPDWERFMTVTEAVYGPLLGGGHAD
jgi:exodeoxyribonuclease V gamma subunit